MVLEIQRQHDQCMLFHIRVRINIWKRKEIVEILERNWHSKTFKRTECMYNSAKDFGDAVIPRVSPRQSPGGGEQGAKWLEQFSLLTLQELEQS